MYRKATDWFENLLLPKEKGTIKTNKQAKSYLYKNNNDDDKKKIKQNSPKNKTEKTKQL